MNLKLYGICFKMRGGPDLLDYIQTNTAVPVDVMEQVMNQMGSITQDEMAFAEKLDNDWKKAFNEKVPLIMNVAADGGYDITCSVPDELLRTVGTLHNMEPEKIVEEYTANYLKEICGIDAPIISVDIEQNMAPIEMHQSQGFDLADLGADPEGPEFEDVSGIDTSEDKPAVRVSASVVTAQEPETIPESEIEPDEEIPYDGFYEDDVPIEEGYPEGEDFPDVGDEEADIENEEDIEDEEAAASEDEYGNALTNIYKDLVTNIRDKQLDTRLGLKIG